MCARISIRGGRCASGGLRVPARDRRSYLSSTGRSASSAASIPTHAGTCTSTCAQPPLLSARPPARPRPRPRPPPSPGISARRGTNGWRMGRGHGSEHLRGREEGMWGGGLSGAAGVRTSTMAHDDLDRRTAASRPPPRTRPPRPYLTRTRPPPPTHPQHAPPTPLQPKTTQPGPTQGPPLAR